jgi:hypothetical protein
MAIQAELHTCEDRIGGGSGGVTFAGPRDAPTKSKGARMTSRRWCAGVMRWQTWSVVLEKCFGSGVRTEGKAKFIWTLRPKPESRYILMITYMYPVRSQHVRMST